MQARQSLHLGSDEVVSEEQPKLGRAQQPCKEERDTGYRFSGSRLASGCRRWITLDRQIDGWMSTSFVPHLRPEWHLAMHKMQFNDTTALIRCLSLSFTCFFTDFDRIWTKPAGWFNALSAPKLSFVVLMSDSRTNRYVPVNDSNEPIRSVGMLPEENFVLEWIKISRYLTCFRAGRNIRLRNLLMYHKRRFRLNNISLH